MIVQSTFTLPVPMDAAFDLLIDPGAVADALSGSRPVSPGAREGDLVIHVGGTAVTFRGRVTPGEQDREAGALSFHVAGAEVRGRGMVTAGGAVRLRQAEDATAVAVQLDVEVSGRMAQQGVDAVEAAVRTVLDELAGGLRRHAETRHPRADHATPAEEAEIDLVAYPWMTSAEVAVGDPAAAATAQGAAAPAFTLAPAAGSAPAPAPARTTPSWSLEPASTPAPRTARTVPGRVTVVTDGPLAAAGIPVGDGAMARARGLHHQRPWVAPALLMTAVVVVVLVGRRRRRR